MMHQQLCGILRNLFQHPAIVLAVRFFHRPDFQLNFSTSLFSLPDFKGQSTYKITCLQNTGRRIYTRRGEHSSRHFISLRYSVLITFSLCQLTARLAISTGFFLRYFKQSPFLPKQHEKYRLTILQRYGYIQPVHALSLCITDKSVVHHPFIHPDQFIQG